MCGARVAFSGTTLSIGSSQGSPGLAVSVPLGFQTDAAIVALQCDVIYEGAHLDSAFSPGGVIVASHQVGSSAPVPGARRIVLYSTTNALLTNGVLAHLVLSIATGAPAGLSSLTLTNAILASALGEKVEPINLLSGGLTIRLISPARIGSIVLSTNGIVQFDIAGVESRSYIIQASTNLVDWTALSTNPPVAGVIQFTDPAAANFRYRFYRALSAP